MKCCASCFGDRGLRSELGYRSNDRGTCDYCETPDEPLIEPIDLADLFERVISIYEPDDQGKHLVQWLKEDWGLFTHPKMDEPNAQRLLTEILDDGEIVRKNFSPSPTYDLGRSEQWEKLQRELKHENRYFPRTQIDLERLEQLLAKLVIPRDEILTQWFRARIQNRDVLFQAHEMSAPPPELASHGRANPAGIPYLYLASEQVTAISETRPHTGAMACVASFQTSPDLVLVDLRSPKQSVSPFLLADEEEVGVMRFDLPFLERLGQELTRPVLPESAAYDYTPSQYLCEFIKKCGIDGVVYKSSVGDGVNLALFDPTKATVGTLQQVVVTHVRVEVFHVT